LRPDKACGRLGRNGIGAKEVLRQGFGLQCKHNLSRPPGGIFAKPVVNNLHEVDAAGIGVRNPVRRLKLRVYQPYLKV